MSLFFIHCGEIAVASAWFLLVLAIVIAMVKNAVQEIVKDLIVFNHIARMKLMEELLKTSNGAAAASIFSGLNTN